MSHESLSALLDGESSPEEIDRLLDAVERSPELGEAFSRMCLAREATAGTRIVKQQPCICAAVMAGLDDSPDAVDSKVVQLPTRRGSIQLKWKPLAGLAAAASLGALAVLVALPQAQQALPSGSPVMPEVSSPVSLPAASRRPRQLQTVSADDELLQQWQEDELGGYLIEHSNTLADRGMAGTLSYARFTAHTADQSPQAPPAAAIPVAEEPR